MRRSVAPTGWIFRLRSHQRTLDPLKTMQSLCPPAAAPLCHRKSGLEREREEDGVCVCALTTELRCSYLNRGRTSSNGHRTVQTNRQGERLYICKRHVMLWEKRRLSQHDNMQSFAVTCASVLFVQPGGKIRGQCVCV